MVEGFPTETFSKSSIFSLSLFRQGTHFQIPKIFPSKASPERGGGPPPGGGGVPTFQTNPHLNPKTFQLSKASPLGEGDHRRWWRGSPLPSKPPFHPQNIPTSKASPERGGGPPQAVEGFQRKSFPKSPSLPPKKLHLPRRFSLQPPSKNHSPSNSSSSCCACAFQSRACAFSVSSCKLILLHSTETAPSDPHSRKKLHPIRQITGSRSRR